MRAAAPPRRAGHCDSQSARRDGTWVGTGEVGEARVAAGRQARIDDFHIVTAGVPEPPQGDGCDHEDQQPRRAGASAPTDEGTAGLQRTWPLSPGWPVRWAATFRSLSTKCVDVDGIPSVMGQLAGDDRDAQTETEPR